MRVDFPHTVDVTAEWWQKTVVCTLPETSHWTRESYRGRKEGRKGMSSLGQGLVGTTKNSPLVFFGMPLYASTYVLIYHSQIMMSLSCIHPSSIVCSHCPCSCFINDLPLFKLFSCTVCCIHVIMLLYCFHSFFFIPFFYIYPHIHCLVLSSLTVSYI